MQPWALSFWQKRDLLMNDDPAIRRDGAYAAGRIAGGARRDRQPICGGGRRGRRPRRAASKCARRWPAAACHHLGGGTDADVGPDLATVRHRPPLSLLVDILSPSQSIAQGYETYMVELTGRAYRGGHARVAVGDDNHAAASREDDSHSAP